MSKRKNRYTEEEVKVGEGKLIPMGEFQREFLQIRGKLVKNDEMEAILAAEPKNKGSSIELMGTLPWETPYTSQELDNLNKAKEKKFICRNKECTEFNKEVPVKYAIQLHKKEVPIPREERKLVLKKFGQIIRTNFHCSVSCRRCNHFIQYVKYNTPNRMAAEDDLIHGPHQKRNN